MKVLRKITIFSTLLIATLACQEKDIAPEKKEFIDESIYTNGGIAANVVYGSSTTQGGVTEDLLMDIFIPEGNNNSSRPLIILAHGGGFHVGEKESMTDLAEFLVKYDFVVASLKYRLVDVEPSPLVMKKAVIDAVHDMRAAIRFFRKDLSEANLCKIDEDNIFVGGYSAGAFMGLHTAYLNSEKEILELGGQTLLDYINSNGGIDGNSGNSGYSSSVKGCISLAGALAKASFINADEAILYSFHGTDDDIVPYTSGDSDGSGVITEGPAIYHPVADEVGITNHLYTVQNGGHDCFWSTEGSYEDLLQFISTHLEN